jgi:hypothetical protein
MHKAVPEEILSRSAVFHPFCEIDQRNLYQNEDKEDWSDDSKDNSQQKLMQASAKEEGKCLSHSL